MQQQKEKDVTGALIGKIQELAETLAKNPELAEIDDVLEAEAGQEELRRLEMNWPPVP